MLFWQYFGQFLPLWGPFGPFWSLFDPFEPGGKLPLAASSRVRSDLVWGGGFCTKIACFYFVKKNNQFYKRSAILFYKTKQKPLGGSTRSLRTLELATRLKGPKRDQKDPKGPKGAKSAQKYRQSCTKTGQESQNFDIRRPNYARGWSLRQHIGLK